MQLPKSNAGIPHGDSMPARRLLQPQISQLLWVGLIGCQQIVAGGAIISDALPIFRVVVAVVAAEASGIIVMTEIIRMGSPSDLHESKDISAVNDDECLCSLVDLSSPAIPYLRIL